MQTQNEMIPMVLDMQWSKIFDTFRFFDNDEDQNMGLQ
jgi:hypothetical protein